MNLLSGNVIQKEKIDDKFQNLNIGMHPKKKVYVFLLRINAWGVYENNSEWELVRFSIWNIVEELLKSAAAIFMVNIDKNRIMIMAQPKHTISKQDSKVPVSNEDYDEKRVKLFINESFSDIQRMIKKHLNIMISIMGSNQFISWDRIRNQYMTLNIMMNRSIGTQDGIIAIEKEMNEKAEAMEMNHEKTIRTAKEIVRQMDIHMELSQENDFFAKMEQLVHLCPLSDDHYNYVRKMIYYSMITVLLGYMDPVTDESGSLSSMDLNISLNAHSSWYDAVEHLNGIAARIFEGRKKKSIDSTKRVIIDIQKYIGSHLESDVSLTSIAHEFCYNASYLSVLFKNMTGESISDYINKVRLARAKDLLKKPEMKIGVITEWVGFKTPSYFTRFFKKSTGYTPQEYRNKAGL